MVDYKIENREKDDLFRLKESQENACEFILCLRVLRCVCMGGRDA